MSKIKRVFSKVDEYVWKKSRKIVTYFLFVKLLLQLCSLMKKGDYKSNFLFSHGKIF